ncbi:4-hydroxybenzoate polyprenyl transferase [Apiospora marii]|uniref:4-hydroxybenzoate polyprenyl transferase n=1 Tax=Apiospora marii TaxID=335849 RepID=UPI00312FDBA3
MEKEGKYVPPTTGILSMLPSSWVPYAELIRLHQPHGIYMIAFPHLVGLLYASSVLEEPVPRAVLGHRVAVLMIWTFFWRSAGCVWNDNIDQDFDRQTARCRHRPIARGAISTINGHVYSLFLVLAALAPLHYCLAPECTRAALVSVALAMVYPFGKRFTDFAQVILGTTLASTVTLSAYSVGLPALSPPFAGPTLCLSAAVALLVVFYDTVYARADTADDLKSGVKGMAVRYRDNIAGLLVGLTVAIVALLGALGLLVGMGGYYYAFAVAGLAASLAGLVAMTRWNVLPSWAGSSGWVYAFAIANLVAGFGMEYVTRVSMV